MNMSLAPIAAALLAGCALSAAAQGVYRQVGPDGRVTFTDQPPPAAAASGGASGSAASAAGGGGDATSGLPFELRQVAGRYPVVLYSGKDCAPCNTGRNLLNARGIPYTEKTVSTNEDIETLKRLTGDASLPVLTIGTQKLRGFSDSDWSQYLTAAGYPQRNTLPSSYRRPSPSPLTTATTAAPAAAPGQGAKAEAPPAPADVPVVPTPSNPAGIRF